MAESKQTPHEKKSQKRKDRQARRAEKRKAKAEQQLGKAKTPNQKKPVKARLSKKSLPGFLAKNVNAIKQWLKDYETLFIMAEDYGIEKFERLKPERRAVLVQNYIDISDFLTVLDEIILDTEHQTELSSDAQPPEQTDDVFEYIHAGLEDMLDMPLEQLSTVQGCPQIHFEYPHNDFSMKTTEMPLDVIQKPVISVQNALSVCPGQGLSS